MRALEPRLELVQSGLGNVERIDSTVRLHHRAQHQGLAAGPRAKINDHFAPLRGEQLTHDLAAFVLDFDFAAHIKHMSVEIRQYKPARCVGAGLEFERIAPAQYAENRVCDELAVVLSQSTLRAKKA